MNLLTRFLRFVIWVLIVSWGFRLLGRFVTRLLQSGHPTPPLRTDRDTEHARSTQVLVRDPVCGVHIAENRAVPLQQNAELLHFCSPDCRDIYLNSSKQLTAHA